MESIEKRNLQAELEALILENTIDNKYDYFFMLETLGEEDSDRLFWKAAISIHASNIDINKIDFSFAAPPRTSGIKELRKYMQFNHSFYENYPEFFICIDSDCYYLIQDTLTQNKKYIFQTYTYSIDSYKCSPSILNQVVREKYLSNFNFEIFLSNFSSIIYPLFCHWVALCQQQSQNVWEKSDWVRKIGFQKKFDLSNNGKNELDKLKIRLQNEINTIIFNNNVIFSKNMLLIKKENCFWFINGHAMESIICIILDNIRHIYLEN